MVAHDSVRGPAGEGRNRGGVNEGVLPVVDVGDPPELREAQGGGAARPLLAARVVLRNTKENELQVL